MQRICLGAPKARTHTLSFQIAPNLNPYALQDADPVGEVPQTSPLT